MKVKEGYENMYSFTITYLFEIFQKIDEVEGVSQSGTSVPKWHSSFDESFLLKTHFNRKHIKLHV